MKLHTPLLVLAATAALAGCYVPSAPDEVLYGNVVATNYKRTRPPASPIRSSPAPPTWRSRTPSPSSTTPAPA